MSQSFYLRNVSFETLGGKDALETGVLHFMQEKSGFDNRATRDHIKLYNKEYIAFKQANPNYTLPWPELDVSGDVPEVKVVDPTPQPIFADTPSVVDPVEG